MTSETGSANILCTISGLAESTEVVDLARRVGDRFLAAEPLKIHTSDDDSAHDLKDLYEPQGRGEAAAGPELDRSLDLLARRSLTEGLSWLPEKFELSPWYLFQYSVGQFIIPHADGADSEQPGKRQLAAISLWLEVPEEGGEFYVQMAAFENDWSGGRRTGLDPTSSSYRYQDFPKWTLQDLRAGDAVIFGSEVVHGTHAVVRGTAIKALCFIIAEADDA